MNPAAAAMLPTNVRRDRRVEESFSSFIVISPNLRGLVPARGRE
jgi:hypothetical protein